MLKQTNYKYSLVKFKATCLNLIIKQVAFYYVLLMIIYANPASTNYSLINKEKGSIPNETNL